MPPVDKTADLDARPAAYLEALPETSSGAVLSCLADGTVVSLNGPAERLLGWSKPELVGKKISQALDVSPEWVLNSWRRDHGRMAAPNLHLTATIRNRLGDSKTCLVRVVPWNDDGFLLHVRDVAEIFAKETAGKELSQRYRVLVEQSSDVVFLIRPNLFLLDVNPAVKTVVGYAPSELAGKRLDLPLHLPQEEIRRLRGMGTSALLKEGIRNKLFRVHRKTGTLFWGLLTLAPIRAGRTVSGLIGVLRDVSEFYETRELLDYQHAQLKRTVAQLEEAYRLQEQFVSNVTHELRTPLTTVLITSELLQGNIGDTWTASQRRQVDLIRKNSNILLDLINDLLDLAKLKKEAFQFVDREMGLREFLEGLVEEMEPHFAQKKLWLRLDVAPSLPVTVTTDPGILRRILVNILGNASKFTREGGATLSVRQDEHWLRLDVTDTGIGIRPEDIPHLFEEFRQVDGSDSRQYPGTGLGLSIADRFVRLLGGRLDVESQWKSGSTFTVFIPFKPGGQAPVGKP